MGLFNRNYDKPGKGVDENAPEKRAFFRFWEMLSEKWTPQLGAAFIHALVSIPFLIILFLIAPVNPITSVLQDNEIMVSADFLFRIIFTALIYILWGCGPATSAYAYVCKCHTLRKPVWVMSDSRDTIRQNFKQSILVALINIAVIPVISNAFFFYGNMYAESSSPIYFIARTFVCIVLLIYTWAQFYIYQIMTTLELSFKQLWKNAFAFAFLSLPFNLVFTVISVAITIACIALFNPMFGFMLALIVAPLFTRLPIEFHGARMLRKLIEKNEETKSNEDK